MVFMAFIFYLDPCIPESRQTYQSPGFNSASVLRADFPLLGNDCRFGVVWFCTWITIVQLRALSVLARSPVMERDHMYITKGVVPSPTSQQRGCRPMWLNRGERL